MVAVVLAVLGVPLWIVVGMLLGGLLNRRRVRQQPGVFACHVRVVDGPVGAFDASWGRVPAYGRWVHDVLLVSRGLALVRVVAVPVVTLVDGPVALSGPALRGLDEPTRVATFRTEDGATLQLAAAADADVTGPFPRATTRTGRT